MSKRKLLYACDVCLHSEHHAIQTIFHELLVKGHELGGEGFQVVDGFVAQLQSMLVIGCQVCHLCLELAVTVLQELRHETLVKVWRRGGKTIN